MSFIENSKYYRKNKTVFRKEENRDLAVVTCKSLIGAALTVRQLIHTDGGRKGDWRKHVNHVAKSS